MIRPARRWRESISIGGRFGDLGARSATGDKLTPHNRLVLLPNRIKGVDIFRVKEKPATVFVSERFKEIVMAYKLNGIDFSQKIPL